MKIYGPWNLEIYQLAIAKKEYVKCILLNFQTFIWYVLIISYFFTFLGANDSSGVGSDLAKQWEITLRQALMPVTQGTSDTNAVVAGPKNNSHR